MVREGEIKYNEESEVKHVPVAFMDDKGDLWIRSTSEKNLMDNKVFIIIKKTNEVFTCCYMRDFINCLDAKKESYKGYNYAVKTFYEGDSITITF